MADELNDLIREASDASGLEFAIPEGSLTEPGCGFLIAIRDPDTEENEVIEFEGIENLVGFLQDVIRKGKG